MSKLKDDANDKDLSDKELDKVSGQGGLISAVERAEKQRNESAELAAAELATVSGGGGKIEVGAADAKAREIQLEALEAVAAAGSQPAYEKDPPIKLKE